MSARDKLMAIIVKNPDLELLPGEVCLYQVKAKLGTPHEETVTTTKTKPGIGVGIRLTKHFGVGVGRQKVTTHTETHTVWDYEPCDFFMLDSRMVLKMRRNNSVIRYDDVTDLKVNKDALTVSTKSQDYFIFMPHKDVQRFVDVYGLLGEAAKEGIKSIGQLITGVHKD